MNTSAEISLINRGGLEPPADRSSVSTLEIENAALQEANRQLRLQIVQLQRLAYLDSLTGLRNRRYFDAILISELRRAKRTEKPFTLLICDVDRFKECNDRYGHAVGDQVLIEIAGLLRRFCRRGGDFAIRYAGDEFALLLPGMQLTAAAQLAENLRSSVAELVTGCRRARVPNFVTLSIGGAAVEPAKSCQAARLVEAADRALYLAKRAGRNSARLLACK